MDAMSALKALRALSAGDVWVKKPKDDPSTANDARRPATNACSATTTGTSTVCSTGGLACHISAPSSIPPMNAGSTANTRRSRSKIGGRTPNGWRSKRRRSYLETRSPISTPGQISQCSRWTASNPDGVSSCTRSGIRKSYSRTSASISASSPSTLRARPTAAQCAPAGGELLVTQPSLSRLRRRSFRRFSPQSRVPTT